MKARWGSLMFVVGIVLAVSGLAGTTVNPRVVQAMTVGCTPSADLLNCDVSGSSTATFAFRVNNTAGGATRGITGIVSSSGSAVGVNGAANAVTGPTVGVYGTSFSSSGTGVRGEATAPSGTTYGVYGSSASGGGYGVYGESKASGGVGVSGINFTPGSGTNIGVLGWVDDAAGTGVVADGYMGVDATGEHWGIFATGASSSGTNYGIYARTQSPTGYAGYFNGKVHVNGALTKSSGAFKIDHPLDPANKYLSHSFVESPDMMNIYNGNVALDKSGQAVVKLPAYFQALNQEFRYQLTALGAPGPNLYIAKQIKDNQFTIAGGTAGMQVSWQVTGIRHDPYAEQNRIQVEEAKPAEERGTYLYPKGYNQPETKGRDYKLQQQRGLPATPSTP
jgi:hypothetical protein